MDEEVEKYLAETPESRNEEDHDIYAEDNLECQAEDGLISVWEEGWMRGYLEADA
ncbi:hypothetical protein HY638_00875 [Candidatus Woesearchaeota archaeon]|nr:hypothetical protein [Candidatus Woesearchaeota archaeon]